MSECVEYINLQRYFSLKMPQHTLLDIHNDARQLILVIFARVAVAVAVVNVLFFFIVSFTLCIILWGYTGRHRYFELIPSSSGYY